MCFSWWMGDEQEFFCNQCWKRVHNGGKRASHDFRVLYDYYQKRVDYGEGEFPSRYLPPATHHLLWGCDTTDLPRRAAAGALA